MDTLTPKEAARQLGIKVETLSKWRATRRYPLPYIKSGATVLYFQKDVDAFQESRRVSGTEAPSPGLRAKPHTPKTRRPSSKPRRGSAPRVVRP